MVSERSTKETVRSVCTICPSFCGIEVHLEKGKIERIRGDRKSHVSQGFLCKKGRNILEYASHAERILYPLRRKGERGLGKWERISWDEALENIVSKLKDLKSMYGPQSVLFLSGAASGLPDILLARLAHAFGSPNVASMGFLCYMPRVYAYKATFGSFLYPDYENPPRTIVIWGLNPYATYPPIYRKIISAKRKGTKIIVVDPRESEMVRIADLWIKLRPGSDLLFCLSVINVVIEEGLYDKEFVAKWTYGFERLKDHIGKFRPEETQKYTWVKEKDLSAFVDIYTGNKPASVAEGNALDQGIFPFQTLRAIYILEGICGNIGVPGGKIRYKNPKIVEKYGASFTLRNLLPKEISSSLLGKELLAPFVHYAHPSAILRSIIDGGQKSPKAAFILRANPVLSWPDTKSTFEALKKMEFLFCADHFITPTSQIADIILPSSTCLEFDSVVISPDFPFLVQAQRKVAEFGEARSDIWIINELGKRLNLGDYFFKDEYAIYDEILKGDGLTFSEFKKKGSLPMEKDYMFFEREGFKTRSKKMEIFSQDLDSYGYDPIPDIEEWYFEDDKDYPLLLTSYKPKDFRHTNFRQIDSIRKGNPYPKVLISKDVGMRFGIKEGDWVFVETKKGGIKARATYAENLDEKVVVVEQGWWFPEMKESYLDFNINVLTSWETIFPVTGSPLLRGVPCRLKVVREENG